MTKDSNLERGCPVVHFEIGPEQPAGHYVDALASLRNETGVVYNTLAQGFWMFTSFDLVREMYQNDDVFSARVITPWEPNPHFRWVPLNMDRPEHTGFRRLLNSWFSPRAVGSNQDAQREVCRRYVEALAEQGGCDASSQFAIHYTTEVFLGIMGLPTDDTLFLVGLVEEFFLGYTGVAPENVASASAKIRDYFRGKLAERAASPRDPNVDILTSLMGSEVHDGERTRQLEDDELIDMCFLLVIAGLHTTRNQLVYMLYHFATHPEDRERVLAHPTLIPSAVEEVIRYYPIIYGDGRVVRRDVEVGGCQLKEGDMVYGMTSAANRDPQEFEGADDFVLDRDGTPHIGFAAGPHRCLGSHLARSELIIALEEWLRVIPEFHLDESEPLREKGGMLSLTSLPLTW